MLPLADATPDNSGQIYGFSPEWMVANAPSLSAANFETTLAVGATMVPVCLRTAAQVCPGGTTSSDASLMALALAESGGDAISLNPGFATGTTTYLASVANGIDTVTLTAAKNDSNAMVVITDDDNTGTPGVAELDLDVGPNTLTVNRDGGGRRHRAGIHDYGHAGGGDDGEPALVHDHDGGGNLTGRQGVLSLRIEWRANRRFLRDREYRVRGAGPGCGAVVCGGRQPRAGIVGESNNPQLRRLYAGIRRRDAAAGRRHAYY